MELLELIGGTDRADATIYDLSALVVLLSIRLRHSVTRLLFLLTHQSHLTHSYRSPTSDVPAKGLVLSALECRWRNPTPQACNSR